MKNRGSSAGQNPARGLTGGWGNVVGKHHNIERNPWVALVGAGTAGGGSSMASSGGLEYGISGEGASVVDRLQGAVGELREGETELMAGSAWAGEVWNGGATVSSSSPACG